jgi:hypothetical protein
MELGMPLASPLDVVALVPSSGKPVTNGIKKGNLRAYSWALPYISSMKLLLNPKQNLHIDLANNRVISYQTIVADIKGDQLVYRGKFSRTTSKHLSLVSSLLGLQIGGNRNDRVPFNWFEYGANVKMNNSLSSKNSEKFLELLKEFKDNEMALVGTYLEVGARSPQKALIADELKRLKVDIEEVTKELNALKKVRDMVI